MQSPGSGSHHNRWLRRGLLAAAAGLLMLLVTASDGLAFDALVAFGDSYTDTGNLPSSPPDYWNGRFSNGPLWIEYLSQSLGFTYEPANNYAVSGSESNELGLQIANFPGTADPASVLFAIWSGNNDIGNHLNLGTSDTAWNNQINAVVSSLMTASDLLYQKGARHLVLFNQIDLTRVPYILASYSPSFRSYILGKIKTLNSRLAASVPNLLSTHPGLQVYYIDVYSQLNNLLNNYSAYGFTEAALDALDDPSLTDRSFTGPGVDYVFWDSQHPTTKTHNLVAGWVASALPAPTAPPSIELSAPLAGDEFVAPATIPITATVVPNGWVINQVNFFENGVPLGQAGSPPYTFNWSGVATGSYSLTAEATYNSGQTVASGAALVAVTAAGAPPPAPWNDQDIGAVGLVGNAYYSSNGTFTVLGSGGDIWNTADAFHFVYQPFSGDGTIIALVTGMQNTDGFAKAGVMFRETLDPGSRNAMQFVSPSGGTGFQWRAATAGASAFTQGDAAGAPYWVKVERIGSVFNGYSSPDGNAWTLVGSASISMASNIYAGLAVTAHNNAALNASTFASVRVTQKATPPSIAAARLANGIMQLTITGTPGVYYRCDGSTNLAAWIPISTNLNTSGIVQITDSNATNLVRRFYRAVQVP